MPVNPVPAEPDDAEIIARVVRETSAGVVDYLMGGLSLLLSPERLLSSIIMETGNPMSHENVVLLRDDDTLAGLLLAYPGSQHGTPDILRTVIAARKFKVLSGLMNVCEPDSLYINTFWVAPAYRGTGLADDLLECARLWAADRELPRLSLHVWDGNARALRFYARHGFATVQEFSVPEGEKLQYPGGYRLMGRPSLPQPGDRS